MPSVGSAERSAWEMIVSRTDTRYRYPRFLSRWDTSASSSGL